MKIVSVETMRTLDRQTIEAGTPEEVLMEQAATAAYREMREFLEHSLPPRHRRRFTVLAGKGNNAGDALVIARLLHQDGLPVAIYTTGTLNTFTGATAHHASLLPMDIPLTIGNQLPDSAFGKGTVIIDGLLGTGLTGAVRPPFDTWIVAINQSGLPVVALDVPSGLNADDGQAASEAVTADLTLTMALPKRGLLTPNGLKHAGVLRCVDIGVPPALVAAAPDCGQALTASDIAPLLGRRPADAHKGSFGRLLVVGGSERYTGAPLLAGTAALRIGTGLATVAVPKSLRPQIAPPVQALIISGLDDEAGFLGKACCQALADLLPNCQAAVIGPGLGNPQMALAPLKQVLAGGQPTVVDADGLRSLATSPDLASRAGITVLTPHPGEMGVLLQGFGLKHLMEAPRQEQALELAAKSRAHIVLKGCGTIIASPDGRWAINTSGSNALASAGTGDVLAGLIGGLLAQGHSAWHGMCAATFIHGLAAELAPQGSRALLADDLLELIGPALRELSPFA